MSNQIEPLSSPHGEVITFYSYKGGTGRSMALANTACLLAGEGPAEWTGKRVLMVDWDLEAPGLHRYFRGALGSSAETEHRYVDDELITKKGLMDLWVSIQDKVYSSTPEGSIQDQDAIFGCFEEAAVTCFRFLQCDLFALMVNKTARG